MGASALPTSSPPDVGLGHLTSVSYKGPSCGLCLDLFLINGAIPARAVPCVFD